MADKPKPSHEAMAGRLGINWLPKPHETDAPIRTNAHAMCGPSFDSIRKFQCVAAIGVSEQFFGTIANLGFGRPGFPCPFPLPAGGERGFLFCMWVLQIGHS